MGKYRLSAFSDEAAPDLEGQIKALHENKIGLMEIRGVDGVNIADIPLSEARKIRKRLDDAGIGVWSIGSPIGKVSIHSEKSLEEERFKRVLDNALALGARCIRLFSFFETEGKAEYRDEVLERLSGFADISRGSEIVLCHENEKGIYGDIPDRCLEIHRAVPGVKAVFDPANFIQCGQSVPQAYEKLKPYIFYGHIKDAVKNGAVVPAGEGDGHMDEYLPDLLADRDIVLTLEPHLQDFVGLSGLETPGETSVIDTSRFGSNEESFAYAAKALRRLLTAKGQFETC